MRNVASTKAILDNIFYKKVIVFYVTTRNLSVNVFEFYYNLMEYQGQRLTILSLLVNLLFSQWLLLEYICESKSNRFEELLTLLPCFPGL